jgi:hypothetical protein
MTLYGFTFVHNSRINLDPLLLGGSVQNLRNDLLLPKVSDKLKFREIISSISFYKML